MTIIADTPRPQSYTHLHVTLFTTSQPRPDPRFFGLPLGTVLPGFILTSAYLSRKSESPPTFHSIGWHGETYPGSGEYAVKVFSMDYLDDDFLAGLAGETPSWVYRKEWDAYPRMEPIRTYAPVEPYKGFHYLAGLEPWISWYVPCCMVLAREGELIKIVWRHRL